jgi:hypothetical protein
MIMSTRVKWGGHTALKRMRNIYKLFVENRKETEHKEDEFVVRWIPLRWNLEEYYAVVWIELVWLGIGTSEILL